jgi:hypothetical protein
MSSARARSDRPSSTHHPPHSTRRPAARGGRRRPWIEDESRQTIGRRRSERLRETPAQLMRPPARNRPSPSEGCPRPREVGARRLRDSTRKDPLGLAERSIASRFAGRASHSITRASFTRVVQRNGGGTPIRLLFERLPSATSVRNRAVEDQHRACGEHHELKVTDPDRERLYLKKDLSADGAKLEMRISTTRCLVSVA